MDRNLTLIGIALALLIASQCLFQVQETQYALKLRLGKVEGSDYDPGLHFKWPVINNIRYFDKRILTLDADAEHFLTSEKKNVIVDSFVKWRIIDPETFFTSMGGNEVRANQRILAVIADGLRVKFGNRTIQEVVSGDRQAIMGEITAEASEKAKDFGIDIVDVRIKRIDLPQEVSQSVYRRMEAERERVAKELRSRGEASAVRIRADADRQKTEFLAQSRRDAEITRGQGEAEAADIYAKAYTQDPEFYNFYRSTNAYRETFIDKSDVLLLEPDSKFFQYFKQPGGGASVPRATPAPVAIPSAPAYVE